MNDIYSMDFSKLLPTALTHDPKMVALAKALADQLLDVSRHINDVLIYSNFDQLPEALVDILAYDMHVDWYDYTYPLEVKRSVVKNSVKVHKRMGTKYAVETALGALWPESEVEEWFDYGGTPYHFRVVCDVTENHITASYRQIVNAVQIYKRLSSRLENVVYQCSVPCTVQTNADYWLYHNQLTSTMTAGTYPRRNVVGAVGLASVIVGTDVAGFIFTSPMAGVVTVPLAGTLPERAMQSAMEVGNVTGQAEGTAFHYTVKQCGSSRKL